MEQKVKFDFNKYMNSLSMESIDPRTYVLNHEVYSEEAIFTRHFTKEEYKEKEAKLNDVMSKVYDMVKLHAETAKKEMGQEAERKGGDKKAAEGMFEILPKDKFLKLVDDIVTGKSKEKFAPICTLSKLRSGVEAIDKNLGWRRWFNMISIQTRDKIDNLFGYAFWNAIFSKQQLSNFFKQKDKDTRKAAHLINIDLKREKGNWIEKLFTSPWRVDSACFIIAVTPKYRIKQESKEGK